jgi:hypothetical protein
MQDDRHKVLIDMLAGKVKQVTGGLKSKDFYSTLLACWESESTEIARMPGINVTGVKAFCTGPDDFKVYTLLHISSGLYFRLAGKPGANTPNLEVGQLISAEGTETGQLSSRTWI